MGLFGGLEPIFEEVYPCGICGIKDLGAVEAHQRWHLNRGDLEPADLEVVP